MKYEYVKILVFITFMISVVALLNPHLENTTISKIKTIKEPYFGYIPTDANITDLNCIGNTELVEWWEVQTSCIGRACNKFYIVGDGACLIKYNYDGYKLRFFNN